MGSEWAVSRLEDLTELIVDCPHSTPKWQDQGEVVLRSQNIRNGRLDLTSTSYTDHNGYLSRVKRAVPQAEDLVLTREAPMGEVCMIPHGLKCCMGQRMVLIRTKRDILSPHYLLYLIQSPFLQHQISWNEGTGTTVSNIRIPNIKAFEIPLPPLPEQKAIAHILGTLDDKIELNRRMNATLEGMAQALFKSWFVDFDPVIDNALAAGNAIPDELKSKAELRMMNAELKGSSTQNSLLKTHNLRSAHHLFPAAFQFTEELGWIPEGWEVMGFGDLAKNVREGVDPTTLPPELPYVGLEHIDKQCLSLSRWGTASEVDSQKTHFKPNDFLFGKLRPYFHKVCHVISEGVCSTDILVIRPHQVDDAGYVGCQIFEPEFVEYANLRSTGTRMPRASWKDMAQYEVACPPENLRTTFNELIRPIREKCAGGVATNQNLGKLRDILLPQLISGECSAIQS